MNTKLRLKQYPQVQDRDSSEARFWRSYGISKEEKLLGAPNCIHFDPSGSGHFIVTASTKISLYDPLGDKLARSYSRFDDDAFSGRFRRDGKLIIAGDKSGYVKVFDVGTKTVLRQLNKHTAAVRATCWTADALHMLSGSDDKSLSLFDLATGDNIWHKTQAHGDYIRHIDASSIDNNLYVSGGFDHAVCMWDRRQDAPIRRLDQGFPVSGTVFSPSGALLVTSGQNEVKVWDIAGGFKCLHTFANHQKDITSLFLDTTGTKIFSSGLDGYLKVYSLQSMTHLHGIRCSDPISSAAISVDGNKLAIGFIDSRLEIRTRIVEAATEEANADENLFSAAATSRKRKFYKGAGVDIDANEEDDAADTCIIESERSVKLKSYETHLKKFNYQQALDAALKTRNPVVVFTVIEELSRRSGLTEALSGRDEITLEPVLSFVCKYIANPKYTRLLVTVCHILLDIYAAALGRSDGIDELMLKLQIQIKGELSFQRQTMKLAGALDSIVHTALRSVENS